MSSSNLLHIYPDILPFASSSVFSASFEHHTLAYCCQQKGLKNCKGNNVTHHQCHRSQQHDAATRYSQEFQLFTIHSDTFPLPAQSSMGTGRHRHSRLRLDRLTSRSNHSLGDILASSSTRAVCGRRWCVHLLKSVTQSTNGTVDR